MLARARIRRAERGVKARTPQELKSGVCTKQGDGTYLYEGSSYPDLETLKRDNGLLVERGPQPLLIVLDGGGT